MWHIFNVRDHVELVVHAVDEKDVNRASQTIHSLGAFCSSSPIRVRGAIQRAAVCLSFDNHSRHTLTVRGGNDQKFSQQVSSNGEDIGPSVKLARKFVGGRDYFPFLISHISFPEIELLICCRG